MPTRDANNATWYLLRYEEDFTPPRPGVPALKVPPEIDIHLAYDPARHVLELLPEPVPPDDPVRPLPGLAVDLSSEVYRVDPKTHQLLVRRCNGQEDLVVCQPQVLARPLGLALDRRGFLYVADPGVGRVVVLLPEDGSVQAVLVEGLIEPVDVAVAPDGTIFVADRASDRAEGGQIARFDAGFRSLGAFEPRNPVALPETPRPIAVMVDADGTLLVADATHPRLLRFDSSGNAMADVELTTIAREVRTDEIRPESPATAYGNRLPRFRAGTCPPPLTDRDGGSRLAEVHRGLRLLRLRLARRFESIGVYLSRALDSGTPGTTWHRVDVEADIPEGTTILVETATAETLDGFLTPDWRSPTIDGEIVPMTGNLREQLVQSPPGRFLRLRLTLLSDGGDTPSVRSVRILYPRVSYLDLLPRVYRRDPESALFLEHFLALFERVFTGVEDRYEAFSRDLNPAAAPRDVIDWLACLVDLSFDPSWPLERRRALVGEAMALYRDRGTIQGIARYVEIYTGQRPEILEAFLHRPSRPSYLGSAGSVLGCSFALAAVVPDTLPDDALASRYAHRFTVFVYLDDPCDSKTVLPVVDRIVTVNKPAHTVHTLCPVRADARVDVQSTVGIDFVLGGREAPETMLGGCPEIGAPASGAAVLGVDSILGAVRPGYARPLPPEL